MNKKRVVFTILFLLLVSGATIFLRGKSHQVENGDGKVLTIPTYKSQGKSLPALVDSEISPKGLYLYDCYRGSYADQDHYYELFVTDLSTGERKKVFNGPPRTLGWEWAEDSKIKISYNCGTGCRATRAVSMDETASITREGEGLSEKDGWQFRFIPPPPPKPQATTSNLST